MPAVSRIKAAHMTCSALVTGLGTLCGDGMESM